INVRVHPKNDQKRADWKYQTLISGDAIVPIVPNSRFPETNQIVVLSTPRSGPSKVTTKRTFHVDMSFAMTFYKAQGQTIPKVILILNKRPVGLSVLTYSSLFVAVSRVRLADDIRLLGNDNISYRSDLKVGKDILRWWKGFGPDRQGLWNSERSLQF
ncbi:MAG: C-terminal helicase domain-containing protein, partial [Gloeomargaritales cyanobacterium]